jgi:hypothetical protein
MLTDARREREREEGTPNRLNFTFALLTPFLGSSLNNEMYYIYTPVIVIIADVLSILMRIIRNERC